MRWRGNRKSDNVEDRRGGGYRTGSTGGVSSLLRLIPIAVRFLGFKKTAILVVAIGGYSLFSGSLSGMLAGLGFSGQSNSGSDQQPVQQTAAEKERVEFVSVILADTELVWGKLFRAMKKRYQEPKLVLFRRSVQSACGMAKSAVGPFYCPADKKVYIDLAFFDELSQQYKAPGDFAQAYVIAHEIGHHVQTLLGISNKVHAAKKTLNKVDANKLSVKQELQADCFAGVWANHASRGRELLEGGDVESGLKAASAIGDDTLQKQARGYVTPDAFTHGSSKQRVRWFKVGLKTGDVDRCNTFNQNVKFNTLVSRAGTDKSALISAYENHQSDVQVQGVGTVKRVLPDDNKGSRHQKFILKLNNGLSILIAHNIDLAEKINSIKVGDEVEFYGEYEWNERGGVVHWTHDSSNGRHAGGWLKHRSKKYH